MKHKSPPLLVLICGFPDSGKTTLASRYQAQKSISATVILSGARKYTT